MKYHTLEIVRTSLELAWKHKILWIFALAITGAGFGGGGGGGDFLNSPTMKDGPLGTSENSSVFYEPTTEESVYGAQTMVLGDSVALDDEFPKMRTTDTSEYDLRSPDRPQKDDIFSRLNNVENKKTSTIFLIVLAISFLLFLLTGIIVSAIRKSWALAATIEGTFLTSEDGQNQPLDKVALSKYGLEKFWNIIKFYLLIVSYYLIFIVLIIGLPFAMRLIAIALPDMSIVFSIISGIIIFVAFVLFILLNLSIGLSLRVLLQENMPPRKAFTQGFNLMFKNFGSFLKITLASVVVISSMVMAIAVFSGILTVTIFKVARATNIANMDFNLLKIAFSGVALSIIVIIFVLLVSAAGGFITTYFEYTWTFLYKKIANKNLSAGVPTVQGVADGK